MHKDEAHKRTAIIAVFIQQHESAVRSTVDELLNYIRYLPAFSGNFFLDFAGPYSP